MSGPGGVGAMKRVRLLQSMKQSKASSSQAGKKTLDSQRNRQQIPNEILTPDAMARGLRSSKRRIFGSPFNQAQSPVIDSQRHVEGHVLSNRANVEPSVDENTRNASKNHHKQGRGPASGQKLDQQVKKHGKYKIWFLPGETDAVQFNMDLSNGIGIIVRTNAEIKGVTRWDDVTEDSKAICYTRLFRKSRVNSENRKKKPFNHTSGKRTMLSHYKELTEKSEIELFRKTHVSKSRGGEFISASAQSKYNEMLDMKSKAAEQGKEAIAEQVIVKSVLGHRSGYIKGMGHGVQVSRSRESNVFAGIDLKEKMLELEMAKAEIINLTNAQTEQSKKIDWIESKMAKMQEILKDIPGISLDFFHDC